MAFKYDCHLFHCGITSILCCSACLLLLIQNMDYRSIYFRFFFVQKIIYKFYFPIVCMNVVYACAKKSNFFKFALTGNWLVPNKWTKMEPEHSWFNSLIMPKKFNFHQWTIDCWKKWSYCWLRGSCLSRNLKSALEAKCYPTVGKRKKNLLRNLFCWIVL